MRTTSLSLILLSLLHPVYANEGADYNSYVAYAKSQTGAIARAGANYSPKHLAGFSDHPKEAQDYSGDTATSSDLTDKAISAESQSDTYEATRKGLLNGPHFSINKDSADIKRLTGIEGDADHISRGISDKYIDCTKGEKMCHRVVSTQSCTQSIARDFTCHENLTIAVQYNKVSECNHLVGSGRDITIAKGPANGKCIAGFVKYVGGAGNVNINTDVNKPFMVPPNLQSTMVIHAEHDAGASISDSGAINGKTLASISSMGTKSVPFSTTGTQTTFTFHINAHRPDGGGYFIGWGYVQYPYVGDPGKLIPTQSLKWVNTCRGVSDLLKNKALCSVSKPRVCTKGAASAWINGKEVTEPCWQYTSTYQCGSADNGCTQEGACDQIGSTCVYSTNGVCFKYREDYSCGKEICDQHGMICGGQFFCMDGKCDSASSAQNQNFGKDAAKVAAAMKAAEDVKNAQSDLHIFTGQALTCRKVVLNTINCCADNGWAKGLQLAHCNDEEKKLHANKEHGLTVDVGDYCASKVAGICLEHKESYCSFDGKLDRIIQKQGRHDQLGISFGDGEHPDCRGISADELSRMDFNKMDFSDVINDMKNKVKLPDENAVKNRIDNDIHNQTGANPQEALDNFKSRLLRALGLQSKGQD